MKLYLLQHGEACTKEQDPQRPLTADGQADVKRMTAFLQSAGVRVQRVIHSGKLRASQTAELLAAAIAPQVAPETSGLMNPDDNPGAFDWQSESWDRDTLLVGHLPFMAKMVSQLVIDDDRPVVDYQPGSMVCLLRDDAGEWRIQWMLRPELLK
jgi:phosphohistidine phosphatase